MDKTTEKSITVGTRRADKSSIAFFGRDTKEWHWAWKAMAEFTGDSDFTALDAESGEAWQYMGSTLRRGRWQHSFRHRQHPRLRRRVVIEVPASERWWPRRVIH